MKKLLALLAICFCVSVPSFGAEHLVSRSARVAGKDSKNLVWRGSASNTLSSNADKNIKSLDKNVQKMFERFPPEPKK